jgi:hypothetical protein
MPLFSEEDIKRFPNYVWNDHFINWWTNLGFDDSEQIECVMYYYDRHLKKELKMLKNVKKERIINYCFITLQNFICRKKDIDKMLLFLKKIDYLYESGEWIIESGKSENIHIHLLVKIINPKKHKNKLNIEWNKLFNNNITDKDFYKLTQWRNSKGMPSYEQWIIEKLDYFKDETKGSHGNKEDLGLQGSFSGGGVILD